jgi:hypothetical protein
MGRGVIEEEEEEEKQEEEEEKEEERTWKEANLIKGTTHETASRIWGGKKINLLVEIVGVLCISQIQASFAA